MTEPTLGHPVPSADQLAVSTEGTPVPPTDILGLQGRFAEISSRAAEVLSGVQFVGTPVRVPRLEMPELQLHDRTGQNTELLVEIARAQQELLGRLVADAEAAAKVEARRHKQMVAVAVLCALLGGALGAILTVLLTA